MLEIVFRTLIMYGYTIFLLRFLGKRGMGQLSILELAIIISFGSAIGDPMMGANVPILHGIVAVTAVAIFQVGLERFINRDKKVEAFLEGIPDLVIVDGIIDCKILEHDNLSKEDLFRSLRFQNIKHLGQIEKAYLETSGQISIAFHSTKNVKHGLSVTPELEIPAEDIFKKSMLVPKQSFYSCMNCGKTKPLAAGAAFPSCKNCAHEEWVEAIKGY